MALGIKVPIQVDALVVGRTPTDRWSGPTATTAPFQDGSELAKGIHLHWALPDALVSGVATKKAGTDAGLRLPAVPDLWIVVRYGAAKGKARPTAAWEVNSRTGKATPIDATWQQPVAAPGRPVLTAAGFISTSGQPLADDGVTPLDTVVETQRSAWAAYYADGGSRFGFHDDLAGVTSGPVSYSVVGWYSTMEDDPLHQAGDAAARLEWLAEAHWTADGLGAGGTFDDLDVVVPPIREEVRVDVPPRLDDPRPPLGPVDVEVIDRGRFRPGRTVASLPPAMRANFEANLTRLATSSSGLAGVLKLDGAAAAAADALPASGVVTRATVDKLLLDPRHPWLAELGERVGSVPDRIYCTGSIDDLPANGLGGAYDAAAPVEVDGELAWTLGDSAGECLARVIEATESVRWFAHAASTGGLRSTRQLGELARVQQFLHEQGFRSETGGTTTRTVTEELKGKDPRDVFAKKADFGSLGKLTASLGAGANVARAAVAIRSAAATVDLGTEVVRALVDLSGLDADGVERLATGGDALGARTSSKNLSILREADSKLATLERARVPGALKDLLERLSGTRTVTRTFQVPRPRVWRPRAPQICVLGPKRGLRHFEDGRFDVDEEGRLVCRLTGQSVSSIALGSGTLTFQALMVDPTGMDRLPATAREFLHEAVLLDPASADSVPTAGAGEFTFHSTYWWNQVWSAETRNEVSATTAYRGKLPSNLGTRVWRRAWNPVFLEYDVSLHPATGSITDGFTLEEVEHLPRAGLALGAPVRFTGRSIVSPVGAELLAESLLRAAADAELAGKAADVERFRASAAQAGALDVLSATLAGLDPALRRDGALVRAGALEVHAIRIVDAFGQVLVLDLGEPLIDADDLVTVGGKDLWVLPPRFTQRARLELRFTRPGDREREADAAHSPVCGWLMADHVEHSVEVFDAQGANLGQLANGPDGRAAWEPAPGADAPWGGQIGTKGPAGQTIPDELRTFVSGVLDADHASEDDESAVSALVRLLDTVRQTVAKVGESADQLSTLASRPIAVCCARARLDLLEEGPDFSSAVALPPGVELRLGSLAQPDDGLLAWLELGVPTRLCPPHASVRDAARVSGKLGRMADATDRTKPITHDYVTVDPTLSLPDPRPVDLLLFLEPGTGVHATTGMLPRKKLRLEADWCTEPLKRLAPTLRAGPVPVDPASVGLPLPAIQRFSWMWTRRVAPAGTSRNWNEVPVEARADEAILPSARIEIQEGWLRPLPTE